MLDIKDLYTQKDKIKEYKLIKLYPQFIHKKFENHTTYINFLKKYHKFILKKLKKKNTKIPKMQLGELNRSFLHFSKNVTSLKIINKNLYVDKEECLIVNSDFSELTEDSFLRFATNENFMVYDEKFDVSDGELLIPQELLNITENINTIINSNISEISNLTEMSINLI